MLLSDDDHGKLLPVPWIQIDTAIENTHMDGPLYIKTLFDRTEYRVLLTNLRYVWYEFGDITSITQRASSYQLDIDSEDQIESLTDSLRQCFQQQENCRFELSKDGQMIIEYKDTSKGFASLSWTFHCLPLESAILNDNSAYLDGPAVLYKHFILPVVAMTESNWLNRTVTKEESSTPSLEDSGRDQDTWLTQLSLVTELVQDDDNTSAHDGEEREQKESPIKHDSLTTSDPAKKLTDPDKELERRLKLESDLMKKRGLKKKKRRLF
ncbi:unnamed protein product [Absidia cylindrospora]